MKGPRKTGIEALLVSTMASDNVLREVRLYTTMDSYKRGEVSAVRRRIPTLHKAVRKAAYLLCGVEGEVMIRPRWEVAVVQVLGGAVEHVLTRPGPAPGKPAADAAP